MWLTARVGVEWLRDSGMSLERCTSKDGGELVFSLANLDERAGFLTVWVQADVR